MRLVCLNKTLKRMILKKKKFQFYSVLKERQKSIENQEEELT